MGEKIDLSILIPSVHTRWNSFGRAIQEQIWTQYNALRLKDQARVEVQILTDNKKTMLGEKRNILIDIAQGRYVVFVDDDDRIEPDYIASLLAATDSDADVITFHAAVSINGAQPKLCRYSTEYRADRNTATEYHRIPNHICCVKRDIARQVSFPNVLYGEDRGYSRLLLAHLNTEHKIDRVLYHYDYNEATTETQAHVVGRKRRRAQSAKVDVVILSNAKTDDIRAMTQTAVDTCIRGANSLPVNVIVVEQQPHTCYDDAQTIYHNAPFHYNAFANLAAGQGESPWIVVANNDLEFTDGWLHELLAANHPFVSPKCPGDSRQASITKNTIGHRTGRHMSGWCFMIARGLWERIGGFDECVSFWCSDDVVIEQCRVHNIPPMLVPKSVVHHIGSVTFRSEDDPNDELTWKQIRIFSEKYGPHRLTNNRNYQEWLAKQSA